MKTEKKSKIIEIKEEIAIEQDGKKIILEKGDRIRVIEVVTLNSILPLGIVNLKIGKRPMINNVYDVWEDDDKHCEFWKDGTIKMIIGSGPKSFDPIGSVSNFVHTETGKFLFKATLIESCSLDDLWSKASKYGEKLDGYVFA